MRISHGILNEIILVVAYVFTVLNTLYSTSSYIISARHKIRDNCIIGEITTKLNLFLDK